MSKLDDNKPKESKQKEEEKPAEEPKEANDASSAESSKEAKSDPIEKITPLESLGGAADSLRGWIIKAWRMATLMGKGAYIVGERRRLFVKLGEEVYYKILKGEIRNVELEPLVQQLDRLTKKVELEEVLIRSLRFGTRATRVRTSKEGASN